MPRKEAPRQRRGPIMGSGKAEGLGAFVRSTRIALGMTQEELARKCGVKQGSIAKVESKASLSWSTLEKIMGALGISMRLVATKDKKKLAEHVVTKAETKRPRKKT